MDQWLQIRQRVLIEGVSRRQIIRETGMHWRTLQKILTYSKPPGYRRRRPPAKPKIGPYLPRITQILESDKQVPRKQRHTAKRIWQRLEQEEGFGGGYTTVKDAVRRLRKRSQEVFMPLVHRPGHGQADFGVALARIGGKLQKVAFFVMALPFSDAFFVMAFPRECTETFWEGHVRAFAFFEGVLLGISYDNNKVCISKIIGPRQRELTDGFKQLLSHYLFKHHFCLVRRPNEKGVAEGLVKFTRLNFLVPVPQVQSLEELNAHLLAACRADLQRRVRGQKRTKAELLQEERAYLRTLPTVPFEACRTESARTNSQSLVRFDRNDYSVPVEYAHHPIVARGYVDQVKLCYQQKTVAVHPRCWDREQSIYNPLHYLPLLQRKAGSLEHARPLADWNLPTCFSTLLNRLEAERPDGRREFIGVLRLLERYSQGQLAVAVEKALRLRTHSRDAIGQYLPAAPPWVRTTFKLDGREHLRHVTVAQSDPKVYQSLLVSAGAL